MSLILGNQDLLGSIEVSPATRRRHAKPFLLQKVEDLSNGIRYKTRFAKLWLRRAVGLETIREIEAGKPEDSIVFVLPGIEAATVHTKGMADGLTVGGIKGVKAIFDWGLPFPGGYLANLTRIDRNRRQAAALAQAIVAFQDAYPGRPVHLMGQSGGAGIAVFAAEALPASRQVDGIVILNGALSPSYNLSKALAKSRKGILNSYSPNDWLVLGYGTRIFGTTDRLFCDAAGRVGFTPPPHLHANEAAAYEKLTQIRWHPRFGEECCHWGGHLTSGCEEYLVRHIAPWVMD